MKNAAKNDKRDQLIPKAKKPIGKKSSSKPGPDSLKTSSEPYIRTRLELPESLKHEIDLSFVQNKMKEKNEFMVEAIRKHFKSVKI